MDSTLSLSKLPFRRSQQGNNKDGSGDRVVQFKQAAKQLDHVPGKHQDEKEYYELIMDVRGILNKLTPQTFDTLLEKFKLLPINSENKLTGVINLLFDKAVDEPSFSKAYALMCKHCSRIEVVNEQQERANFRKMLITRCQVEFEKNKVAELDAEKWHEEINACTDPDKRKEKQLAYEEKELLIRMKSIGNIRFIGELFILGMLTSNIMVRCIEHLLGNQDDISLECLCKLLTTVGKDLELGSNNNAPLPSTQVLDPYFQRMHDLAHKKGTNSKVSSRVRFMLQDVIELRQNRWVPRREDNPKTMDQITQEAQRQIMDVQRALSQLPLPRRNRSDDRKGRNPRNPQTAEDGWNTVSNSRYISMKQQSYKYSRMGSVKCDLASVSLGDSGLFRYGSGARGTEPRTMQCVNTFSALQLKNNEMNTPQLSMNSRRVTPIDKEKERQRMLQGSMGSNDRTSSRESSVPLQAPPPPQPDVYTDVELIFNEENSGQFIEHILNGTMEKKAPAQLQAGKLFSALLNSKLYTPEKMAEVFSRSYEFIEDMAIDMPMIFNLQAGYLVPILGAEKMNFGHFKTVCSLILKSATAEKVLVPVVTQLAQEKGAGFVRSVWDSSEVDLKDFLAEGTDVESFVKKHSIQYLNRGAAL